MEGCVIEVLGTFSVIHFKCYVNVVLCSCNVVHLYSGILAVFGSLNVCVLYLESCVPWPFEV